MTDPRFLLTIHNHQPVGNFERVFDWAFRECYDPLMAELERHPRIKFSLHFSGPLWEHMERREPACWDRIKTMAARGQVELLGGGFYEPILSVIPEEDRLGQLELMQGYLAEHFGTRPRGIWLAERVWEPSLPSTLARAGIEYTLLDEEHFRLAGVEDIHASYLTEDQGFPLRIFPIDKTLRYLVPFRPLGEVRAYLRSIRRGGIAVLGDDGEKFGLWPGTGRIVYEERWLARFLDEIEREGVATGTLSQCLDELPPRDRVYLPPGSYEEMMEWVLEPDEQAALKKLKADSSAAGRRFMRGGNFRDFFRKYPESNILHKRMLLTSKEVRSRDDEKARKQVYMAQGNDPYWHGVFGGLYLPHLRRAAYSHLILAEKSIPFSPGWTLSDLDLDGHPEAVWRSEAHSVFIKPGTGGSIFSLDSKRLDRNLLDVLSRRREAYHQDQPEGSGEGKSIHELARALPPGGEDLTRPEGHCRFSLIERFFAPDSEPETLGHNRSREGGDFIGAPYEFRLTDPEPGRTGKGSGPGLVLQREGRLILPGGSANLHVLKRISPRPDGLAVAYEIQNRSKAELRFLFGSEWNFSAVPGEWDSGRDVVRLFGGAVRLGAPGAEAVWSYPLHTLSQSEKGYDIIHQGVCFIPVWRLTLPAGAACGLELAFSETPD